MNNKEKIRLFLGTYIDPEIVYSSNNLEKLEDHLNCSMKFVEKKNIHLTWKFIGDIETGKTDKIIELIRESINSKSGIEIGFNKFAIWPNGKFPRQLVVTGNDINENGRFLCKNLNNSLQKAGIEKEKRSFNPHITVARFRIKEKPKEPFILPEWLHFKPTSIKFNQLDLIQSTLTGTGSIYQVLKSFEI